VNKILGHADLKMTMRYAHPNDSLKVAVESLSVHYSEGPKDNLKDISN
jgi:hypothetical protein